MVSKDYKNHAWLVALTEPTTVGRGWSYEIIQYQPRSKIDKKYRSPCLMVREGFKGVREDDYEDLRRSFHVTLGSYFLEKKLKKHLPLGYKMLLGSKVAHPRATDEIIYSKDNHKIALGLKEKMLAEYKTSTTYAIKNPSGEKVRIEKAPYSIKLNHYQNADCGLTFVFSHAIRDFYDNYSVDNAAEPR